MKSKQLLDLINAETYLYFVDRMLEKNAFSVTDLTEEGDSILHVLVQSRHATSSEFSECLMTVIAAGANINALDGQGKLFFSDYIKTPAFYQRPHNRATQLLIIKLSQFHPTVLYERLSDGTRIFNKLVRHFTPRELVEFFRLCGTQESMRPVFNQLISEYFEDWKQQLRYDEDIIEALIKAESDFDVEYCLALTFVNPRSRRGLIDEFLRLKPNSDPRKVKYHIIQLTAPESEARATAFYDSSMYLNYFDDEILAWEENYFLTQTKHDSDMDIKLFGHLFSLDGSVPGSSGRVELTGSSTLSSAAFFVRLMNAFFSHCETQGMYSEYLDAIRQVRNMTVKALRYHYLMMGQPLQCVLKYMMEDSQHSFLEIITGWPDHGISLIIKQDDFYRNNGGGCSNDTTTEHYKISKPAHLTTTLVKTLYQNQNKESNKTYIQKELHQILGLVFTSSIEGTFQTVGNCSFQSLLIALKIKYRLFLPVEIADRLYSETVAFFEHFCLESFIEKHSSSESFPHILLRLIVQKLIPTKQTELAKKLIDTYFSTESNLELMHMTFLIQRWRLQFEGDSTDRFDEQLQALGVVLNKTLSYKIQDLERVLSDQVADDECVYMPNNLLPFAVGNNNLTLAKSMSFLGLSVNSRDWMDRRPLCFARSVAMIDLLVKSGARVKGPQGADALECAIRAQRADLVKALLQHGAQPSNDCAYIAATGDPQILQLLIEFYPETIQQPAHDDRTPIHGAALAGRSDTIHSLVYYGKINPNAVDVNGITPLQLTLKYGHDNAARHLLQYPGLLFNNPHRGDLVSKMTSNKDLEKAIEVRIQEQPADLDYFTAFKGRVPDSAQYEEIDYLIIAIRMKELCAIRGYLLTHPEVNVLKNSNHFFTNPLADAVRLLAWKEEEEPKQIVAMLLKTPGININAIMPSFEPLLFMAVSIGNLEALELFLADPKLDPNQQDNLGYTALHDAAERGHVALVRRLLQDERVDSTIVTYKGKTAAELDCTPEQRCATLIVTHQQHLLEQSREVRQDLRV